jgi:hypothetical protein
VSDIAANDSNRLAPQGHVSKTWVKQFLARSLLHLEPGALFHEELLELCGSLAGGRGSDGLEMDEHGHSHGRKLIIGGAICSSLPVGVAAYTLHRYLLRKKSIVLN